MVGMKVACGWILPKKTVKIQSRVQKKKKLAVEASKFLCNLFRILVIFFSQKIGKNTPKFLELKKKISLIWLLMEIYFWSFLKNSVRLKNLTLTFWPKNFFSALYMYKNSPQKFGRKTQCWIFHGRPVLLCHVFRETLKKCQEWHILLNLATSSMTLDLNIFHWQWLQCHNRKSEPWKFQFLKKWKYFSSPQLWFIAPGNFNFKKNLN